MISVSLFVLQFIPSSYANYWSDLLDPCVGAREGSGIEFLRPSYCDETQPSTSSIPGGDIPSNSGSQIPDGYTTIGNKQLGISILYPLGWQIEKSDLGIVLYPGGFDGPASITVAKLSSNVNRPVIDMINDYFSVMKNPNAHGSNIQIGQTIQLHPNNFLEYYITPTLVTDQNGEWKSEHYIGLTKSNELYLMIYTASKSLWSQYLPIFKNFKAIVGDQKSIPVGNSADSVAVDDTTIANGKKLEELRNINEEYKIKSEQIKSEHCAKMNIIGNMRIGPTTEKYWDSYCEVYRYR